MLTGNEGPIHSVVPSENATILSAFLEMKIYSQSCFNDEIFDYRSFSETELSLEGCVTQPVALSIGFFSN